MSELRERSTKKLAELKAYLEKKVVEDEEEIRSLKSFLEVIDLLLAERSYRRAEVPKTLVEQSKRQESPPQSIRTVSGVVLADMHVNGGDLRVVPGEGMKFDTNTPPFRPFLLGKVLEPMQKKDEEAVRKGGLSPDRVLSFDLDQQGSLLKQLRVKNYGDETRLSEIKNAVRWTFRKMYEKTIGT
ncbi:MAG TPA: hypothetical protein VFE96_05555 [Candidatus Bathyarchaeia archaeon]|jgi:hypothetical protein|nr:hypothetical protein [Candidatus Bathyarchaeia archaeon]